MKSIEEKAKAYDEALARANEMIKSMTNIGGVAKVDDIQHIFPELKESDDERISGNIIATIHLYYGEPLEDEAKEMIAWLEKQCEQKIKTPEESLGIDSDTYNKIVDECIYGEQKVSGVKELSRAKEEALKAYHPKSISANYDTINRRDAFEYGYLKAEKDLELTLEDIRELHVIFADVDADIELCKTDIKAETLGYYQEVLKRFNKERKEV